MIGPGGERRTVVAIVHDDRGWMICGTVDGVVVDTPKQLSAPSVGEYLRVFLPDLFGGEPQHLTTDEVAALDAEADRRLGDVEDGGRR